VIATNAQAGGLWLNNWGDFSSARASAGAAAGGDEAATIIHNPATAANLEGRQLFLSAGVIIPDIQFDVENSNPIVGTDDGGDAGLNAPIATFAYVHGDAEDRWRFGAYTAGLAGAGLDYNDDWVGRFQATDVEILVLAFAPTVSYKFSDTFSIGFAPQAYYGTLDLDLALPAPGPNNDNGKASLDGDDTGFSYNVGLVWKPTPLTSIGLDYQAEVELDFDGKLKANVPGVQVNSNTELPLAAKVRLGINHNLDDQIGFWFTLGWDDWSALDEVFVSLPEVEAGLKKNWDDTYHYAAGFQYKLDHKWEIASGVAYDTNPVDATDRTADLPIDRQIRYNLGARYTMRDNLTIGGYLNYTDLGSAKIDARFWSGEYERNSVIEFAVSANWTF
jgi:long-chain fatty acid transport protein